MLGHPHCPQPLPCLIYQWSIRGQPVALTLSVCQDCSEELKDFVWLSHRKAASALGLQLLQPGSLLPVPCWRVTPGAPHGVWGS